MYFTGEKPPRLSEVFAGMNNLLVLDLSHNGLSQKVINDVRRNLRQTRVADTRPFV